MQNGDMVTALTSNFPYQLLHTLFKYDTLNMVLSYEN
jgi:hypothetical protein